jgi:hypothetical protein
MGETNFSTIQLFNDSTLNFSTSMITLSPSSRVWVYSSNKPFDKADVPALRQRLQDFAQQWVSHNRQLRADADVLHDRFVVLMVDETQADASGCSIDSSVTFLKGLQAEFGVDLFNRMIFSYQDAQGQVHSVERDAFARLYATEQINDDTLVFDPLVSTKQDLDQVFLKKLSQSWHKRMI